MGTLRHVRPNHDGFVLVELIVVLGLLVAVFVLYHHRGSGNFQKRQQALCRQNLQTIHLALQTYATDYEGKYPALRSAKSAEAPLSLLVPKYTTRTEVFICPGSKDRQLPPGEQFEKRKISYAYLMGLTTAADRRQWLMADALMRPLSSGKGEVIYSTSGDGKGTNHDKEGGVILFGDGTVEITRPKAQYAISKPVGTSILNPAE